MDDDRRTTGPLMSVVLPVRNGERFIAAQLGALARQVDHPEFELIISDNGSSDGTVAVADQFAEEFPRLVIVDSSGRPGVAHARNVGTAASSGEVVAFCDADDEVESTWLGEMWRGMKGFDLAGGSLEYSRLNSPESVRRTDLSAQNQLPVSLGHRPYAVGCNLAVKRAVFDELGGFDTWYQGGHEEVDFAWRAQEAGYTLGFLPAAVVHYRLRETLRGAATQFRRYGYSDTQLRERFAASLGNPSTARDEAEHLLRYVAAGLRPLGRHGRTRWILGLAYDLGRLQRLVEHHADRARDRAH